MSHSTCAQAPPGNTGSRLSPDPGAPAKLQNNEAVAAKPKSGAKTPWNARPRATGRTEYHLKEGLSSVWSQGPAPQGAAGVQLGFPAHVPCFGAYRKNRLPCHTPGNPGWDQEQRELKKPALESDCLGTKAGQPLLKSNSI